MNIAPGDHIAGCGPAHPWPAPAIVERIWEPDLTAYPRPPSRQRDPYPYHPTIPAAIAEAELLLPGAVAAALEEASRAIEHLSTSAEVQHYELVASPLLRSEAVSSSRIEGLRASHRAIAEAREVPGAARATAVEIASNIRAMERAITLAQEGPLTVEVIKDIHLALAAGTHLASHAGQIRTGQNWIGPSGHGPFDAVYVPPPHEEVPRLLDDLARFAARQDLPAVAQAAIVHAQFEGIHPFPDGNGRVGRALIHVVLRHRGLSTNVVPPISTVLAARRDDYIKALSSYQQQGDLHRWTSHFAAAAVLAARRAEELGAEITDLVGQWHQRLGTQRAGASVQEILPLLIQRPIVSAATAAESAGITETAARRVLGQLETAGILRQITVGRRNRVWAAEDVFDLLDRFEYSVSQSGDGNQRSPTRHLRRR